MVADAHAAGGACSSSMNRSRNRRRTTTRLFRELTGHFVSYAAALSAAHLRREVASVSWPERHFEAVPVRDSGTVENGA